MCGICGMIGHVDKSLLKRMCDVIQHRGSDDPGFLVNDRVGLGDIIHINPVFNVFRR